MANITQKWVDLLLPFTNKYGENISEAELARLSAVPQQTASRHLKKLVKANILEYKIQGRNKLFYFNHSKPGTKITYTLLESQKALNFLSTEKSTAVFINELIPHADTIIIFGSYASGTASKSSDLDIIIIGNCDIKAIKKIKKKQIFQINEHYISYKEFFQQLRSKNALAIETLKKHIIFGNVSKTVDLFVEATS